MSLEELSWLNTNTVIGFTEKRGKAWHWRESEQGAEPNHYPGAIPVEDVRRRLFHWEAVDAPVWTMIGEGDDEEVLCDLSRKVIIRPDTKQILAIHSRKYVIHQFQDWLLDSVATLLDDDLQIGSAGLLRLGAIAWVSVEVPENVVTPEGVEFRPHLLATTSHDSSFPTTYNRCITNVVCDNTHAAGVREGGSQRVRIRHTSNSLKRLQEHRDTLGIVYDIADDFKAEVAELTAIKVSDHQWQQFLNAQIPVASEDGSKRTVAMNKQAVLSQLWREDERVAPWKNTGWGVVQAVNTAMHHKFGKDEGRVERNMLKTAEGKFQAADRETVERLQAVLV